MVEQRLPPMNAVRAFDAAARLGSYVEASKALHVTQPAIGRHVKLLEEWLGVQLFERTSRGVILTAAGTTYHRKVAQALQLIIEAGQELQPRCQPALGEPRHHHDPQPALADTEAGSVAPCAAGIEVRHRA